MRLGDRLSEPLRWRTRLKGLFHRLPGGTAPSPPLRHNRLRRAVFEGSVQALHRDGGAWQHARFSGYC